jgi:lysophospholipase L1-like esterase
MLNPRKLFCSLAFAGFTTASLPVNSTTHGQEASVNSAKAAIDFAIPDTDDSLIGVGPMRRADWFRNVWRGRRTEFANRAQQDQEAVVFFGDSITQGWGGQLENSFAGMKVANRGISGDTTRGMLNRLQSDVLDLKPKALVLLMGTNDLEENAEPETIATNVKSIIAAAKQYASDMPVVLCLVMPSSASKKRPSDKIKELNRLYAEIATVNPQVFVLDTWTLFADEKGDAKPAEFPDLLHPNEKGYVMWAAALQPVFATLGFTETEAEPFTVEDGFVELFNGKDLTGWGFHPTSPGMKEMLANWKKRDPNAPSMPLVDQLIAFDGMTSSPDGRFVAKNGRLIVMPPIEGRRIQTLSTVQEFEGDCELRLEFRALPMADSGVFVRGTQLQCRDYITAGPYKQLTKYRPQEWNELVIVVKDNVAHCTCNGELLEAAMKLPPRGPMGVEGDRGQIEYRRIRIKLADK